MHACDVHVALSKYEIETGDGDIESSTRFSLSYAQTITGLAFDLIGCSEEAIDQYIGPNIRGQTVVRLDRPYCLYAFKMIVTNYLTSFKTNDFDKKSEPSNCPPKNNLDDISFTINCTPVNFKLRYMAANWTGCEICVHLCKEDFLKLTNTSKIRLYITTNLHYLCSLWRFKVSPVFRMTKSNRTRWCFPHRCVHNKWIVLS